jgi:hypothetical protein
VKRLGSLLCGLGVLAGARLALADQRVDGCVNVQDYLAVGDDMNDDTVPIQNAINAALMSDEHAVCIPGGIYKIVLGSGDSTIFDLGGATNFEIVGEGTAAVLRVHASDGMASDWNVFALGDGTSGVRFTDFAIDLEGIAGGTAIFIGDPSNTSTVSVSDVLIRSMQIIHVAVDAIAVEGGASGSITDVGITNSRLADVSGAAIALRGHANRVQIAGNYFDQNDGYDVVTLTTTSGAITSLALIDNVCSRAGEATQPLSLSIAGTSTYPGDVLISGNALVNGAVSLAYLTRATLAGNTIFGDTHLGSTTDVTLGTGVEYANVLHNSIVRNTCDSGVVLAVGASGANAQTVSITSNFIEKAASDAGEACNAGDAVSIVASDAIVLDNYVAFAQGDSSTAAIAIGPSSSAFARVTAADNAIEGDLSGSSALGDAFYVDAGSGTLADLMIVDNTARHTTTGVDFGSSISSISVTPFVGGNSFDGSETSDVTIPVAIHGNNLGPVELRGSGDPTTTVGAASLGSTYQRTDGGSGTTFYRYAGGGWSPLP